MLNTTTIIKACILFSLTLTNNIVYSQSKKIIITIRKEVKALPQSIRKDENFRKAYMGFIHKEYDSTLLYTHNFLNSQTSQNTYSNYCHFFRGISLEGKALYSEAKKELLSIPKSFPLRHVVTYKLGAVDLELGNFREALECLLKTSELPPEKLRVFEMDILFHDIGNCYLHLENYEKAENYLFQGLELQEVKRDTNLIISSYMDIANLYYVQYKDDQAIPFFERAYSLSELIDDFTLKKNAALNMAVVEENRKDFVKSIEYRKQFERWKDSLNDQNKVWEVAQLEKKFISEKNQAEIALLAKDNSIKKAQLNSFIYSSILLLLLAGTLFYFYLSKRKANKLILLQKTELDALNDTKDRLFSVVSHDLRSNVNALDRSNSKLSKIMEDQHFENLSSELQHNNALTLSIKGLLDNMLNWALLQTEQMYFQQEDVSLAAIVNQTTHNYLPLSNSKGIQIKTIISKSVFVHVDIESIKIVMRNVLDNAIKFCGVDDQIFIYTKDIFEAKVQLIIEDTGTGMDLSTLNELLKKTRSESNQINQERTGLGLHLCHAMIHKNMGDLNIESKEGVGTKIIITLPLTQSYE